MYKCEEFVETFNDPGQKPGLLLWQISNLWHKYINHQLDRLKITFPQLMLLKGLSYYSHNKQIVTQVELGHFTKMNVMMVSQILRILEKKNYIKKIPHPSDTRAKCLELTNSGKQILNEAAIIIKNSSCNFFTPIQADIPALVKALQKLSIENQNL